VRTVFQEMPTGGSAQLIEFDRNHWQRKVGALMVLIEHFGNHVCLLGSPGRYDVDPEDWNDLGQKIGSLIDEAHRVVNTSWSGNLSEDPHADVAKLSFQESIRMAVHMGLVTPVPGAPEWLTVSSKKSNGAA